MPTKGVPSLLGEVRSLVRAHDGAIELLRLKVGAERMRVYKQVFDSFPPEVRKVLLAESARTAVKQVEGMLEVANEEETTDPNAARALICPRCGNQQSTS